MPRKILKVVGWTLGMTAGLSLITDGKSESGHPWQHALIGASIGLIFGLIFSRGQQTRSTPD
jgi:hypothetical protein